MPTATKIEEYNLGVYIEITTSFVQRSGLHFRFKKKSVQIII
jgi:hypothetical protein